MKKYLAGLYARYVIGRENKYFAAPVASQSDMLRRLIATAENTSFGREHRFCEIKNYADFKERVQLCNYENLRPYVERIASGEHGVLWPGRPEYFAKTSGTTSGAKYIPLTREGLMCQIKATRNMLLRYILATGNVGFVGGKMIFLQGSPVLNDKNGIKTGRLSGIVAHHIPFYLQSNRKPTFETNCIEDWEEKVEAIVDETAGADMTLISGIPSWLQMYFERLTARTGKKIGELFPHFSLLVTGGVNFSPYRARLESMIGRKVDVLETYPASEGFIAASDSVSGDGSLLLMVNSGIFYEFVPADRFYEENPPRLSLEEVCTGVNYAIILSTNSGLWAYAIGDTVEFTSLRPYRIKVTGRISHYTSAFGEHVIAAEAERSVEGAALQCGALVSEFTLAPQVNPTEGLPYHEWFIEFSREPDNMDAFARELDRRMCESNIYYRDLIEGRILRRAVVRSLPEGSFASYMKSVGRLGGQNKLPRLSNDRSIADALGIYVV